MVAIRYAIYLREKSLLRANGSLQDAREALEPTIQKILKRESGDRDKAELLYISVVEKGPFKGLLIAIDYDNPAHHECCVLGFRIRGSKIRPISVPAKTVHQRINSCPASPALLGVTSVANPRAEFPKQTSSKSVVLDKSDCAPAETEEKDLGLRSRTTPLPHSGNVPTAASLAQRSADELPTTDPTA